jgi:hypothetical protein
MVNRQEQRTGAGREVGGRRYRPRRLGLAAIVATSAWALLGAAFAQASTVTVGSVLPVAFSPGTFEQVKTLFNTALPEKGANLVSPVNGAIVRWRMQGASGGPYYLRVLRPNGSGAYAAAGTSGPATPSGAGLQTFTANMPIHAGDLIGIDPTNPGDGIGIASVAGAGYSSIFPPPFDGATVAPSATSAGSEIELSAEVQPTPTVTSLSPNSGSVTGGDTVTIVGRDFNSASAVKFGSKPAAGFTVESDTQITATTPAGSSPGAVDVTVTTLAGTSPTTSIDRFVYKACVVPKLKGKKLQPGRKALRRAHCSLGRVKGSGSEIVTQHPKPGKVLAPGSKVNVKLGG